MLILQIFLNVVCIDLWLCCYFTYFLNAVYVIQTLCVNVYFGAFCKCVLLRLVVLLAVLLSSLVLLYRLWANKWWWWWWWWSIIKGSKCLSVPVTHYAAKPRYFSIAFLRFIGLLLFMLNNEWINEWIYGASSLRGIVVFLLILPTHWGRARLSWLGWLVAERQEFLELLRTWVHWKTNPPPTHHRECPCLQQRVLRSEIIGVKCRSVVWSVEFLALEITAILLWAIGHLMQSVTSQLHFLARYSVISVPRL